MQRAIIVLILIIVGIGIYLFNQKSASLPESSQNATPQAIKEPVAPQVKAAAQEHIEKLTTESKEQVLDITNADNFVTGEQLLAMPTMAAENITIERVSPSSLQAESQTAAVESDSGTAVTNADSGVTAASASQTPTTKPGATQVQVNKVIDKVKRQLDSSATAVVQTVEPASQMIQGSAQELQGQSIVVTQGSAPVVQFEVAEETGNLELTRAANGTSLRPGQRIRLQELLSDPDLAAGTVFYIHAVSPNDEQGLWGILQHGLIKTFAQGIELKESGRVLTAEIPMLADETLENRRSSFLGEFLYQKVNDTYVYNYQQGMLGQDPNLIKPGQQLIIVSYTEDELISIFNHFTRPGA